MTPRCSQCRWLLADGETHGTLECIAHLARQVEATRAVTESRVHRGLDVGAFRKTMRDVVAVGRGL